MQYPDEIWSLGSYSNNLLTSHRHFLVYEGGIFNRLLIRAGRHGTLTGPKYGVALGDTNSIPGRRPVKTGVEGI